MVAPIVYISLILAIMVSFWSSLVEATYLTLRPFSLSSSIVDGSAKAAMAMEIVNEKTKLVSVTTFVDTISNVVLASSIGLILSSYFGSLGWVYSALGGSFVIMVLLYLLPKAIGIENALRMSMVLAPTTRAVLRTLAPLAVPLTNLARNLSERLVGKPGYKKLDLSEEFEDVVTMLEKSGHIEPDAGKLLRTALASSRTTAFDAMTPVDEVLAVDSEATVMGALKSMGKSNHPRMPVYDAKLKLYLGAVTTRTISKAVSHGHEDSGVREYIIQPARVDKEDALATVIDSMQDAATTIAFVYEGEKILGVITLSDILERVLGVKV